MRVTTVVKWFAIPAIGLVLPGCPEAKPSPEGEGLKEGGSEEPRSDLPGFVQDEGDSLCGEGDDDVPRSEWRGLEPSFAAWTEVPESIFVGTVSNVYQVDSPVYLQDLDDNHEARFTELASVADCPSGGDVLRAIRIEFVDVKTLHGKDVGDTLTIEMGRLQASVYPGIGFREGRDYPSDAAGQRVYQPGARVGAAIFTDDEGKKHWNYRQFEVVSGIVHLQEVDFGPRDCNEIPLVIGIPDEFDGIPLAEFEDAIAASSRPLTDDEEASVAFHHDPWQARLSEDRFKFLSSTICIPPHPPFNPENGENNRVSDTP